MNQICPNCRSERVATLHRARRAGGAIGMVGGGVGGAASALSGARAGMTVGVVAGPPGLWLGGFLGAMLGACVGGATVGLAGARLGEVIDDRILHNHRCLACGFAFSGETSRQSFAE